MEGTTAASEEAPERGVAFFDMDKTLIAVNTGRLYARALRREGKIGLGASIKIGFLLIRYKMAMIDMEKVSERVIRQMEGTDEAELRERCRRLYEEEVRGELFVEMIRAMRAHRERGEPVVVLSASTPYMVGPLAEELDFDDILCTTPAVADGKLTGSYIEPICYGAGKLVWAERYCDRAGCSLAASTFYTDSYTDLPVLEAVGTPIVCNPDPRLAREARRRGWTVHHLQRTLASEGLAGPDEVTS